MKNKISLFLLRWAAKRKLARLRPFIIAVTGSVGKSTCLTLLDGVISPLKKTRTTKKGNSESGLPLEILGIRNELVDYRLSTWIKIVLHALWIGLFGDDDTYDVLIAEFGIDSPHPPKNMSYLLTLIPHPDIAMVISVAPVHTEQFSGGLSLHDKTDESVILSRIAKEKMLLAHAVLPKGHTILAIDSSYIRHEAETLHTNVIAVGTKSTADYKLVDVRATLHDGSVVTFIHEEKTHKITFPHMVVFKESAATIVAVIAATEIMGIPMKQSIETIEKISRLPPGRLSVLNGIKNTTIIDSSYNASPESMRAALLFLKSLDLKKGKRIAILGDMRELGPLAEKKHQELARIAAENADYVVCIGPLMRQFFVPEILLAGFKEKNLTVFETAQGVGSFLSNVLREGDVILVKGSQNTIFLETVVKDLLQKDTDVHLLCRQSAYWEDVRASFFSSHPQSVYGKSTYSK